MKKINWNALNEPVDTLYTHGKASMTDSQVLAVVAQIETSQAQQILLKADNNLANLARWSVRDWMEFDGIGITKASSIITAFELGRRRSYEAPQIRQAVTKSADIYEIMRPLLLDEQVEYFYVLLLNRRSHIIKKVLISKGGTSATVVDPKVIFKIALQHLADAIILVHNHPSGQLSPSEQDKRLTTKISDASKALDINLLDHVIFTDNGYYSFADYGLL
ncbi:RadC family protein [Belliella pelovolcani]|uniref:JAB domain-containing protein n=1 Tax=Belliella pelovolcani TaxID=529505 RepID=UPI003919F38C